MFPLELVYFVSYRALSIFNMGDLGNTRCVSIHVSQIELVFDQYGRDVNVQE